jgi:hypothetical protein
MPEPAFNLHTKSALGISVPPAQLGRADEAIEQTSKVGWWHRASISECPLNSRYWGKKRTWLDLLFCSSRSKMTHSGGVAALIGSADQCLGEEAARLFGDGRLRPRWSRRVVPE